jgi:exodeoxyribonuclease VIII
MSDYDSIKAMNWSSLKHLAVSPLLYRWRVEHPQPPKAAYTIGGAIHCRILEPEKFDRRYAVYDGTRRGAAWDAWQEDHPGVESLKPAELAHVENVGRSVLINRDATQLLKGGLAEETLSWQDAGTGLACKGRLDYLRPAGLLDLKSAREVDPWNFTRASGRYMYHGQVAWYHDGAIAAGRLPADAERPYILAVQSVEPYDCAVYQLSALALATGRQLYQDLLRRFVECTAADWWPGCATGVQPLEVPEWAPGAQVSTEETEF